MREEGLRKEERGRKLGERDERRRGEALEEGEGLRKEDGRREGGKGEGRFCFEGG